VGLAPKFQIIAGTMKRKKDCIQFLRLKKKAHNPVTKEDVLMVINNNAHPTYQLVQQQFLVCKSPTWFPTWLWYHQGISSAMTNVLGFEC
jgi:hypothetical protein